MKSSTQIQAQRMSDSQTQYNVIVLQQRSKIESSRQVGCPWTRRVHCAQNHSRISSMHSPPTADCRKTTATVAAATHCRCAKLCTGSHSGLKAAAWQDPGSNTLDMEAWQETAEFQVQMRWQQLSPGSDLVPIPRPLPPGTKLCIPATPRLGHGRTRPNSESSCAGSKELPTRPLAFR
jgi:hypothetical protein